MNNHYCCSCRVRDARIEYRYQRVDRALAALEALTRDTGLVIEATRLVNREFYAVDATDIAFDRATGHYTARVSRA